MNIDFLHELGEDKQIELINGHLIYNEAPNLKHQMIVQNLGRIIDTFIRSNNGKCQMFNVGVNLYFEEDNNSLLIPDLVVLCDDSKLSESGITGTPDWIIEVVSRSTRRVDYNEKMHKYMEEQGYTLDITDQRLHHEIYLSDVRKVTPERLKTVIRHPIRKA